MKRFFMNRISIGVFSFLFGCVLTSLMYFKLQEHSAKHWNPFQINSMLSLHSKQELPPDLFEIETLNSGSFSDEIGRVTQREDSQFIYLDIDLKGQKLTDFRVEAADGYITLSGEIQSEENSSSFKGLYRSSFHKSFPAPEQAQLKNYQVQKTDDKITLKFDKMSS